ncbi:MAG: hypothetical protein IK130_00530 [Oscillospiraceae bacterium]|nr:hypothetical protein [Oscillospiraceae bacterium]
MKMTLKPLKGVIWDNQMLAFGDTRETVEQLLGKAQVWGTSLYYFQNAMRLDFDEDGGLEFIEFLSPGKDLSLEIYGIDPFTAKANDVIALLAKKNDGRVTDCDNGYCITFGEISVGVYRDSIPEDAADLAAEAEAEGTPLTDEEYEAELSKANHWETIGFGVKGYYERRL